MIVIACVKEQLRRARVIVIACGRAIVIACVKIVCKSEIKG